MALKDPGWKRDSAADASPLEPERYEFFAPPPYHFAWDRREFFAALGAGIVVLGLLGEAAASAAPQRATSRRRESDRPELPDNIGAWLHLDPAGAVTVYTGKVEVGQGVRTSLAQEVAQELAVELGAVRLVMGDTRLTPFDMGTFGSRTTPAMGQRLRHVAAAARDLLVQLAAARWGLDVAGRARLRAARGRVLDPLTGASLGYGELAQGRRLAQAVALGDPLTPATDWTIAGASPRRVGGEAMVTGAHKFPYDQARPGMLFGKISRPPAFGAHLLAADLAAARALPGVVATRDGDFLGVAAPTPELAERALALLRPRWSPPPSQTSSRDLPAYLLAHPAPPERGTGGEARFGPENRDQGSLAAGWAEATRRFEARYSVAYIQHAPLEPRAAVAEWAGGGVTVWTGTQRPFGVREQLMEAFRLAPDQARVLMPDTGGAYGGKHTGEAALEAARLARAAGRPVSVRWTREEEFTWAYFRPAGVIQVRAGLDAAGQISAWEFDDYNSGAAGLTTPYAIPHLRERFHPTEMPLRQGSYRCLAATANQFARESAMDELALAAGVDGVEFRRRHLGRDPRLVAVLTAAARAFGWPGKNVQSAGRGCGIACGTEKGGRIATAVELTLLNGQVKLERIVSAFECGAIVNPDNLKNQVAGAAIMGIGGALFEAVEFASGRVLTDRFSQYRVPRFLDAPEVEVVLVDRKDLDPAGAGECPIMAIAPAIAGAIFQATGKRLRAMPLRLD